MVHVSDFGVEAAPCGADCGAIASSVHHECSCLLYTSQVVNTLAVSGAIQNCVGAGNTVVDDAASVFDAAIDGIYDLHPFGDSAAAAGTADLSAMNARLALDIENVARDLAAPTIGAYETVIVPPAWTCESARYDNGACDCGCGALDLSLIHI